MDFGLVIDCRMNFFNVTFLSDNSQNQAKLTIGLFDIVKKNYKTRGKLKQIKKNVYGPPPPRN